MILMCRNAFDKKKWCQLDTTQKKLVVLFKPQKIKDFKSEFTYLMDVQGNSLIKWNSSSSKVGGANQTPPKKDRDF